ncbi:MAG: hypothetical protein V4773_23260 [Verrucomicrobiota bacterium]
MSLYRSIVICVLAAGAFGFAGCAQTARSKSAAPQHSYSSPRSNSTDSMLDSAARYQRQVDDNSREGHYTK